jgi:hypothetical protein
MSKQASNIDGHEDCATPNATFFQLSVFYVITHHNPVARKTTAGDARLEDGA